MTPRRRTPIRAPGDAALHASRASGCWTPERDEIDSLRAEAGDPYYLRTHEEIVGFFEGLELLEPGVVSTSHWRPDNLRADREPPPVNAYCAVARKP